MDDAFRVTHGNRLAVEKGGSEGHGDEPINATTFDLPPLRKFGTKRGLLAMTAR